ncbi:MAG: hypothetical protein D6705_18220, partial [Deltaproteobacteria bacterium]
MKRMRSTPVALTALLGLAACKGGSAPDPIKLVPDAAKVMGAVDVKGLRASKLYTDNKDKIETGEYKEFEEAAKACNVDPNGFERAVFGADPASEQFVITVVAKGIGKVENIQCMADKAKEKGGEDDMKVVDKDGAKILEFDGGKGIGYPVGNDMLVVTSSGWAAAVKELIDGKGKAAVDGSLKDIVAKAPKDKHIWFAGVVTSDLAPAVAGSPLEPVKSVYGGIDLSKGLAATAGGLTDAPEKAAEIQKKLQEQFDQFKPMLAPMGVPEAVVNSIKIEAADKEIKVSIAISDEDLKTLQEKVAKMMGGAMGGRPPGPPSQP